MHRIENRIQVSVSGQTIVDGQVISKGTLSFELEYQPLELLRLMTSSGPEFARHVTTLFKQFEEMCAAPANDNEPKGKTDDASPDADPSKPPMAAEAASDVGGDDSDLILDDEDEDSLDELDIELKASGDGVVLAAKEPKDD